MSLLVRTQANVAAFRWALGAAARSAPAARRSGRVNEVTVPAPPAAAVGSRRAAGAGLRVATRNCLVRSLVRQAWLAAAGDRA